MCLFVDLSQLRDFMPTHLKRCTRLFKTAFNLVPRVSLSSAPLSVWGAGERHPGNEVGLLFTKKNPPEKKGGGGGQEARAPRAPLWLRLW